MLRGIIAAIVLVAAASAVEAQATDPAHTLAQKFAAPTESAAASAPASQPKPDSAALSKAAGQYRRLTRRKLPRLLQVPDRRSIMRWKCCVEPVPNSRSSALSN
jgi:hypothetical protein